MQPDMRHFVGVRSGMTSYQCTAKKNAGVSCDNDGQCRSGHCATNNICCNCDAATADGNGECCTFCASGTGNCTRREASCRTGQCLNDPSADSPQSRAANHPPTTAPPPATTTRAVVRPPSFSPPAATSRTTATTPSTRSPQAARSGSRTRTWSPWMCWSLEAAEVVLRSGVVAVAGQCRNSTAEL